MKFSFPVPCRCGETFQVPVTGPELPKSAQCPKCELTTWLVTPLGNVVGMAILGRAATELKNGDWTLAIVLAAMAVECELVYLFMKWNRIDLILVRNPTDADDEGWEKQWRDDVSGLLKTMQTQYPAAKSAASPKDFFVKEFFHKRNKIVHFTSASTLSKILAAMDVQRRRALEAKYSIQTQALS